MLKTLFYGQILVYFTSTSLQKQILIWGESFMDEYSEKWELSCFEQMDYRSINTIYRCVSKKYGPCMLKLEKYPNETQMEVDALMEYSGTRFCRVYEADQPKGVILIEQILPGTQLRDIPSTSERLDIFCHVLDGLHREPLDKSKYPTYMGWVSRIAEFMRTQKEYAVLSEHMSAAEKICSELCKKYSGEMLLHGDLHHDNILLGHDNEYRIIDPKGVVGDRVLDIPRFILNEFEDKITDSFPAKYQFIVNTLSHRLGVPKADLFKLVYVETSMANSWNVESESPPDMKQVDFTRSYIV